MWMWHIGYGLVVNHDLMVGVNGLRGLCQSKWSLVLWFYGYYFQIENWQISKSNFFKSF